MAPAGRLTGLPGPAGRRRPPRRVRMALAGALLVPLLEVTGIVLVSRAIGGWWTFLLLLLAAACGAVLVARAGPRAWRALRREVGEGVVPGRAVGDPVLVLLGGLLLVLPGFLSDLIGLLLVLPFTRPLARTWFRVVVGRRMPTGVFSGQRVRGAPHRRGGRADDADVIEGEIVGEWPPEKGGPTARS